MSADISKMFREVGLNEAERDYHHFLLRTDSGGLDEWRMTQLTFGVTSSPFLASSVLRQVAPGRVSIGSSSRPFHILCG